MRYKCSTKGCSSDNFTADMAGMSTCVAWSPRYDAEGRPLNANPNSKSWGYICNNCNSRYTVITKGWLTKYFQTESAQGDPFLVEDATPSHLGED